MARTKAAPAVAPASEPVSAPSGEIEQPILEEAAPIMEGAAGPAPEPVERPISAREQMMAEIVAKRNAILESEVAEGRAQGGEPEPEPAAPPQDALNPPAAPRAAAEPSPAPAAAAADATPRTYKITVRGQQIELPEGDLIRAAEAGVHSQAALFEAQRYHEEALRLRAPNTDPSARPSPPAATAPNPQAPPPGLTEDESLEIARALQYGDEKEVADAVRRMTAQRQASQPAIDPAAIARDVHERVGSQLRLETDLRTFASEYSDIVQDAPLTTLAAQYVQQLRAHYNQVQTPVDELTLFRQAGEMVRGDVQRWAGGTRQPEPAPAPQPTTTAPSGESARTIIKRSTPNAPAAAGAIHTTPAQRAMTPKDVVNWMRQKRGQPVYN